MSAPNVTVIDYGVGNLLSVQRGFEYCGANVTITSDRKKILAADRVVLPGVGAFRSAMQSLERLGFVEVLQSLACQQKPLLCICLGMQLLFEESEEFGITRGLGLLPGRIVPIPTQSVTGQLQKIPHIGWSALQPSVGSENWYGTLLQNTRPGDAAYFVHSFMAIPANPLHRIADCEYGGHLIPAVIGSDGITGCQFHPEKSGAIGLKILRRFCAD